MKTYDSIKVLAAQLSSIDESAEDSMYHACWLAAADIAKSLETDLKGIAGGSPRVCSLKFRINDVDHQGADTCVAHVTYDPWDLFDVMATLIINHGAAHIFVRRRPQKAELEPIANKLDKGEFTHLRDLSN